MNSIVQMKQNKHKVQYLVLLLGSILLIILVYLSTKSINRMIGSVVILNILCLIYNFNVIKSKKVKGNIKTNTERRKKS